MSNLPCPDGGGSLNNPDAPPQTRTLPDGERLAPYVPPEVCVGEWDISTNQAACSRNELLLQENYIAETLSISGAPVNIYRLLGVHEQGQGSVLSGGTIYSSPADPSYPLSNLNGGAAPWATAVTGSAVVTSGAFLAVDFEFKRLVGGDPEYLPPRSQWTKVAAIRIRQVGAPANAAQQVRVDLADGEVRAATPQFTGVGNGAMAVTGVGPNSTASVISALAMSPTEFLVVATLKNGQALPMGHATVGAPFNSTYLSFTITAGTTPFATGDLFTVELDYVWRRVGVFNLTPSGSAITLNLQGEHRARAVRVAPTLFTGGGAWQVLELDVLDTAPTDINNVQDLIFSENRDRDYEKVPVLLKCQYQPTDSLTDLSKFGLSVLDQYSFTTSFAVMVQRLGRPLVVGDIIELPPELQYDQNLLPARKFLEVTDTGWSAAGFNPAWRPLVFRFSAQQVLPAQETRDIFGTLDTQRHLVADGLLADGIGEQLNVAPLSTTDEIRREAADAVPEAGSDEQLSTLGQPVPIPRPSQNPRPAEPQPQLPPFKANVYQEDGLPPNGEPYQEGYALPPVTDANDGDYFRLYYPEELKIPPRLYRFSAVKNRWIYLETDRRGDYSSHRPSVRKILQSNTKQGLKKKHT